MSTFLIRKRLLSFLVSFFITSCGVAPSTPTVTATALLEPIASETIAVTEITENMTYDQAVNLFDYPSDIPFEVKERSAPIEENGVTVYDILYTAHKPDYGAGRGWTVAYLVRPEGEGPFAGILFMHWLGSGLTRREFLDEAKLLAKQGVVSLLIDGTFPWTKIPKDGESDRLQVIDQVIELRRAIDFLLTQPGIDPQRIGYVGHDYGGLYGGVLSGVETRIKTYVLMAAPGNFSNWSINYFLSSSVDETEYRDQMAVVEPMLYIPHADPATLLFQFANNDGFVPKEEATKFFDAASDPKEIKWYDTSHRLDASAQADRLAWLTNQLDLPNAP
jgi:dienelactone hydrolase